MSEDGSEIATPREGDMPYIRYAINHLSRGDEEEEEEEENAPSLGRQGSTTGEGHLEERPVWDEGLGYFTHSPRPTQRQEQQQRQAFPARSVQSATEPGSFVAVDPPEQSPLYPSLDFVPLILQPWALSLLILCCLLMIAGVSFCNVWSRKHDGLWNYDGQGGARYFVMQFLPQILAAILILWTIVVQAAVYRIMPFAIMATERRLDRVLQKLPVLPRNFLVPDVVHFVHGEPLVNSSLFTIWLANLFAIPLLSCLFQAKWYSIDGQGTWRWASVQAVGWTIVSLYGVLTLGLLVLLVRFVREWTGLMWDPTSLADLIPMIQRSSILRDFEGSETAPYVDEIFDPRVLRLGYWKSSRHDMITYGIGEVETPVRSQRKKYKLSQASFDVEQQDALITSDPGARHRWTPWFLRDISMITWTVLIGGLFIAFVLVSFIDDAIAGGFPPRLPTLPSTGAFSSSNFLYSFIPSLIGTLLFLAWQPVDVAFRAIQPYATLSSSATGAHAEHSLLLAYPAHFPLQITIHALLNKHFKLAYVSLVSLLALAIPILAGGVFLPLWFPSHNGVLVASLMPAFYALVAFCALYTVSLLAIWPSRTRYLPHDISTLADQISFLYQSPLLEDKLLREPRSRVDLATRLVMAPPEKSRVEDGTGFGFGFGRFVGRDGKEHLGVDRLRRAGRSDMIV